MTLMIPDSKPYVKFFEELDRIISNFEKPLKYNDLQKDKSFIHTLNGI